MCAFWFRHTFLQPRLRNVKYLMRLDSDSIILSNVSYDIFDFMEINQIKYAFKFRQGENDCCAKRMAEYVYNYSNHYSLLERTSHELSWLKNMSNATLTENPSTLNPIGHQPDTYYTNFEVINVPAFRDDAEVWRFIDTTWHDPLLHLHGIYTMRWGDTPSSISNYPSALTALSPFACLLRSALPSRGRLSRHMQLDERAQKETGRF